MHRNKVGILAFVLIVCGVMNQPGYTTPRLAAKFGQFCFLCHQDPGGAGMRNNFGSQFVSIKELPVTENGGLDESWPFQTNITDNISIGGDFRSLIYYSEESDITDMLTMEGNLYVAVQPTSKFLLLYNKSLRARDEIIAVGYVLPWKGYVRIGTFTPNFGIRFADHTAFVRERLGFALNFPRSSPQFVPGLTDTGIGLGIYPGPFHIDIGVYNGSPSFREFDKDKAFSSRLAVRQSINELSVIAGGSYYENTLSDTEGKIFGGFAMIGYKNFSLLAEIDQIESTPTDQQTAKDRVMTYDIGYFVRKGVDVRVRYDLFLPRENSVIPEWKSVTAGIDVFPYFFLETILNYRYHMVESMNNFSEVDVQIHFWF